MYRPFAFIDDRKTNFEPGFAHLSLVPEAYVPNMVTDDTMKVLHYQFVDYERMLIKQRWARLLEYEKYPQPRLLKSIILNNKYFITKDERGLQTTPVPDEWLAPFPEFTLRELQHLWHIDKSMEYIERLSPEELAWLDIWDYNWPNIADPRNKVQKWYHNQQYLVLDANNVIPKRIKEVVKKI
jgi:hypothetical protein